MSVPAWDLLAGVDVQSQVDYYGAQVGGLDAESRAALLKHAHELADRQGEVFRRKTAVVIMGLHDIDPLALGREGELSILSQEIEPALASTSHGDMVLVTLGFGLCPRTATLLEDKVVGAHGWDSFVILHVHEFEGYSSAINRAMSLVPPDAITAVFTPSARATAHVATDGNGTDLYRLYASTPRRPLLLSLSSRQGTCEQGGSMPILIFDEDTYHRLGTLDEVRSRLL
jgi:hypothetical protein